MCGFIAQLVEQRTGNAEVTGSNPVEALILFRLLLVLYMSGLLTGRGRKSQILTDFWGQISWKNRPISREFSGANFTKKRSVKNSRFCGYFQGKFRQKSIGFVLIRPAFLPFF